jgi:hypothetical protein
MGKRETGRKLAVARWCELLLLLLLLLLPCLLCVLSLHVIASVFGNRQRGIA